MAEYSGFFPDIDGDREYTTDFLARWVASFIGNGVYDGTLGVTAGDHMQIILPAGQAWINGYYYRNDGSLAIAVENADGVLARRDTVVLRWDINTRSIVVRVMTGTPAASPAAPAIIRGAEQYDLKLAEISIPAGTTAITQALITDYRLDTGVCGIVTGVVEQVDTGTFYSQIQDDLAQFKAVSEAGFDAWFDGIRDILDESAAANLLTMVNELKQPYNVVINTVGTITAQPNTTNAVGSLTVLEITISDPLDGQVSEYVIMGTSGATAPTITITSGMAIDWGLKGAPIISVNSSYIIAITAINGEMFGFWR